MSRPRTARDVERTTVTIDAEVNDALRSHARGNHTKQHIAEDMLAGQLDLLSNQHPIIIWSDARVTMNETRSLALSLSLDGALEALRSRWRNTGTPITKGELASLLLRRGLDTLAAPALPTAIRRITLDLDPDVDNALHAELARRRTPSEPAISMRQIIHDALRTGLGLSAQQEDV